MSELKPCPFCGGEPETFQDDEGRFYVACTCKKCTVDWVQTASYINEEKAIDAWNTRYEPTCTMNEREWDDGQIVWGCKCSNCGDKFTYESGNTWSYCPSCGARVVDGDE